MAKLKTLFEDKISTDTCKKFLAEFFVKRPELITGIYLRANGQNSPQTVAIAEEAQQDAVKTAKWKRKSKHGPDQDEYWIFSADGNYPKGPSASYSTKDKMKSEDIISVREFVLDEDTYYTTIAFEVLEGKDGKLYLGEYVGD